MARRLLLAKGGLLGRRWSGLPGRSRASGPSAHKAVLQVIRRFGYLQLDTVSVAGARSQAMVLMSRLEGLSAASAEELLRPPVPLFEYWGHEASWIPLELYSTFAFRRKRFRNHPWWGDIIGGNKQLARDIVKRIRREGPLKSVDLEGSSKAGWWNLKPAKRVALALWSSGDLAIRERRRFQRVYDIPERVYPPELLEEKPVPLPRALEFLLEKALEGHGIATSGILAQTWRFRNMRPQVSAALGRLQKANILRPCVYATRSGTERKAWILTRDLELLDGLARIRPREDRGVLLSPFDPILWDRTRVMDLFGFHQVLEIFTPAPKRTYGYFCLPVLAGERLVARVDLKADRSKDSLRMVRTRYESTRSSSPGSSVEKEALDSALERFARGTSLKQS